MSSIATHLICLFGIAFGLENDPFFATMPRDQVARMVDYRNVIDNVEHEFT